MDNVQSEVKPHEWLYRRGYSTPERKYLNPDGTATSRVFKLRSKDEGKLSVDVKSMTTFNDSIKDPKTYLLFEILNQNVLDQGLRTLYDPLPDNTAHAIIVGMTDEDDVIPGILARKSKIVKSSI